MKIGEDHAVHSATNIVKRGEGECGDDDDDDDVEVERWQAASAVRMLIG